MARSGEHLASQHHRHRNVAHFGDAEPRYRLLQRHHGRPRPQRRRIRDSHDLARERRVGLNQARQLRRIGRLLRGELGELCAYARQGRDGLRTGQGLAQVVARRLGDRGKDSSYGLETHEHPSMARTRLSACGGDA